MQASISTEVEWNEDIVEDIAKFLPASDLLRARLVSKQWVQSTQYADDTWNFILDRMKTETIPLCPLFDSFTIESDHPCFKDHPLLISNKQKELMSLLNIANEEEADEAILKHKRVKTDPMIESWLTDSEKLTAFEKCMVLVDQLQNLSVGHTGEDVALWYMNKCTKLHDTKAIVDLLVDPVLVFVGVVFLLLCLLRNLNVIALSWNAIFPIGYAVFLTQFAMHFTFPEIMYYYWNKAKIHTGVTRSNRNFSRLVTSYGYLGSLLIIAGAHLYTVQPHHFTSRMINCLIPFMVGTVVVGLVLSILVFWRVKISNVLVDRAAIFCGVFIAVFVFMGTMCLVGYIALVGLRIDRTIKVNWAVLLIPLDFFVMILFCVSCISILSVTIRPCRELVLQEYSVFECLTFQLSVPILSLVMIGAQVILAIPSIPATYVLICVIVERLLACFGDSCSTASNDMRKSMIPSFTNRIGYEEIETVRIVSLVKHK